MVRNSRNNVHHSVWLMFFNSFFYVFVFLTNLNVKWFFQKNEKNCQFMRKCSCFSANIKWVLKTLREKPKQNQKPCGQHFQSSGDILGNAQNKIGDPLGAFLVMSSYWLHWLMKTKNHEKKYPASRKQGEPLGILPPVFLYLSGILYTNLLQHPVHIYYDQNPMTHRKNLKNISRSSPIFGLSNRTTYSQTQTDATVPFIRLCIKPPSLFIVTDWCKEWFRGCKSCMNCAKIY